MDDHRVPTYTRVWEYPLLIRGLGDLHFYRPIQARALVAFAAVLVLEGVVLHRLGVHFDLIGGALVYLGIPALAGWGATVAPLRGKRIDRWAADHAAYMAGPKVYDRFRPVVTKTKTYHFGGEKRGRTEA